MSKSALRTVSICCLLGFLVLGCSSKTTWNKAQIESKIKEGAKLKEVHLTETGNGTYEGTGTGENGTTYQLKATYTHGEGDGKTKNELRWEGEDSNGNRIGGQTAEEGTRR
jgi:hypothetical protein